jgi:hypothetical protein
MMGKSFPKYSPEQGFAAVSTFQSIITCWNHNEIYLSGLV